MHFNAKIISDCILEKNSFNTWQIAEIVSFHFSSGLGESHEEDIKVQVSIGIINILFPAAFLKGENVVFTSINKL